MSPINPHNDGAPPQPEGWEGCLFTSSQVEQLMEAEFGRCQRHEIPLACMLLEVDRLENLVAIHGYTPGQVVRRRVAELLRESSRAGDLLGHPDGDHLWILLPHADRKAAEGMAERIRRAVKRWTFTDAHVDIKITVSIGLASNEQPEVTSLATLRQAAYADLGRTRATADPLPGMIAPNAIPNPPSIAEASGPAATAEAAQLRRRLAKLMDSLGASQTELARLQAVEQAALAGEAVLPRREYEPAGICEDEMKKDMLASIFYANLDLLGWRDRRQVS